MSFTSYSRFLFYIICLLFVSCKNKRDHFGIGQDKPFHFPVTDIGVTQDTVAKWHDEIQQYYENLHQYAHFNGNVLVARRGNIIYSGSFGVENLEDQTPLNSKSVFQIASTSKTFTAMAIMLLVQRGKIKLNQTVDEFFKDFPYSGVTISDLLSHRSGLPNYILTTEKEWQDEGLKSNQDLLEYFIEKHPAAYSKPDVHFQYNNTNYALLALIIEKASKKTFEDFMQQNIFDPLNMKDTYIFSYRNRHLPKKNITTGYLYRNRPDELVAADGIIGDKNIYTTTNDLLKWERANVYTYLFDQATLDSVQVGRSNEKRGVRNYGYGWRIMEKPNHVKLIYHNGWWHGYTSTFSRNPADETVIIVLSNIFNKSTYRIQPVWDILYGSKGFTDEPSE